MKLLFENRFGDYRVVAEVANREEAATAIADFLKAHEFKSYYTRNWISEYETFFRLNYDVGSHTEFFVIDFPTHEAAEKFLKGE